MKAIAFASAVLGGCLASMASAAPAFVWIEAERPASSNSTFEVSSHALLSDGRWLSHLGAAASGGGTATPAPLATPLELAYVFDVREAGGYAFWARVGYEWVRAPLEWKLDDGDWTLLPPDRLSTSLMELWTFCEVAWVKAGDVELAPGPHKLQVRVTHPGPDGRVLVGLDCFAFLRGKGWTPEGKLKPGEAYDGDIDRKASQQVFRMPDRQLEFTPGTFGRPTLPPKGEAGRVVLSLNGAWQVARYDDPDMDADTYAAVTRLPGPDEYELRWRGVEVPGDPGRPEQVLGHRLLYRTRVDVPAALAGRSFTLHSEGTSWLVSVFVNGELAGTNRTVTIPWDVDVTRFLKPGRENTIVLAVKDGYYALDTQSAQRRAWKSLDHVRNLPASFINAQVPFVAPVFPTDGPAVFGWINQPLALVAAGPVRVADAFVRTSVTGRRLDATVTLSNPGAEPAAVTVRSEAFHAGTCEPARAFASSPAVVPAGGTLAVEIGGDWPDAKLWWPAESADDKPDCYVLRTTVLRDGTPIDVHDQLFGFREIAIAGTQVLVNGVPWHFWEFGYGLSASIGKLDPQAWLERYHGEHARWFRLASSWGRTAGAFGSQAEMLEFFDRSGVPLRWCSPVNGMFATFDLTKDLVWQNIEENLRAFVRTSRNHPSVFMYSLENELLFINARLCFAKQYEGMEDRFAALCRVAKEIDPTRFSFGDGAGDLRGQCEVNCQHYHWDLGARFPASLYAFETKRPDEDAAAYRKRTRDFYAWDGLRPLLGGEEFFYSGNLGAMAWIGGPDVYRGKGHADKAAGLLTEIACQGTRWQRIAGVSPGVEEFADAAKSFHPRAAFVREWNSAFFAGEELRRTVMVFNDGRRAEPLTLKWRLVLDGREAAAGSKTYSLAPGASAQDTIVARLPQAERRIDGTLELDLSAAGNTVFADSKPVCLLRRTLAWPGTAPRALAVFDPGGAVCKWLEAHKVVRKWTGGDGDFYTAVTNPAAIPADAKVLLIGAHALTPTNKPAWAAALGAFVRQGRTAIVLEQRTPLEGDDLPLPGIAVAGEQKDKPARPEFKAAGGLSGCVAFPLALAHPLFRDLTAREFFTWSGDEQVFRLSYATPAGGAIALLQGGNELGLTPVMELPVGAGSLLLCQALVATRLEDDPVADRLLFNALAWAAGRAAAAPGRTVVVSAGDAAFAEFLARTGVKTEPAGDAVAALGGDARVLVVRATPAAVSRLASAGDAVRDFCGKNRWIMLCGLDAQGQADFDRLTGVQHRLRPFKVEAVVVRERTDPLLMGLSDRDFSMYSDDYIADWKQMYWISGRVFGAVVDGSDEDVASFARLRSDWLFNTVNGLLNDDMWKYILYLTASGEATKDYPSEVEYAFDRPETFTGLQIWSSPVYFALKDIELVFDDTDTVPLVLAQTKEMQEFTFPPRRAAKVVVRVKGHYPSESKQNLVQIDNLRLLRAVPDEARRRAVMLTHPGGLAKYPIGEGGILLNQIDWTEAPAAAADPRRTVNTRANAQKKLAIFGNLLRNMGAGFAAPTEKP